jgi:hypothetical protein
LSRAVPVPRPVEGRYSTAYDVGRRNTLLIALVALSRALILEIGGLAFVVLPKAYPMTAPGYIPPRGGFWFNVLLAPWAHWDGYWYLSIARYGYAGPQSAAFFPLYPLLVHVLGDNVQTALLISTVAFGVGLWLLYKLAAAEVGTRAAWFSVIVLAYFPVSFYFTAAYPEALVLALSGGSLLLARQGRYGWAALLAGITSAASVYGVLLAIPIALYMWRSHHPFRTYLWLLLVPTGMAAFMVKLFYTFQNPLMFKAVQRPYWGRKFAWPWHTLYAGVQNAYVYFHNFMSFSRLFTPFIPADTISNVWNVAFFAFGVFLLVIGRRYISWPLWWYALFVLLVPFLYPSASVPLMSAPRFLLASTPLFIILGSWVMERPWALRIYIGASLLVGALLIALFTTYHWVA